MDAASNSGSCAQSARIAFGQGSAVKNTSSLRSEQRAYTVRWARIGVASEFLPWEQVLSSFWASVCLFLEATPDSAPAPWLPHQ